MQSPALSPDHGSFIRFKKWCYLLWLSFKFVISLLQVINPFATIIYIIKDKQGEDFIIILKVIILL